MAKKREYTKSERVLKEEKRLKALYSEVPDRKKKLVDGLIARAAYMRITLEEYETDINERGSVEQFQQSPDVDPYERARPVAQLYNTMNKNYQSIIKQLADLLPAEIEGKKDDGFDDFVNEREDA